MDKISNERKAQIFYQGDGSQTQYSFSFDYLRKAFVHVSLISDEKIEELTQGTDYTVTGRVVTLAAPTGLKIKIYRQTATKPLIGWADASVLRAADMTVQSTQLLHLAEETSDLAQDGGLSKDTTDNVWDARYNKIKNLLDPTEPGDAVPLHYITKNQTGLLTQLNNTGDAQNKRLIATGNSQNKRLIATGDSQNSRLTTTGNTQNSRLTTTGNTQNSKLTSTGDTQNTRLTNTGTSYVNEMKTIAENARTWDPTYYLGAKPELKGNESSTSAVTIPFKQGIYDINYGYPSGLPSSTYKFSVLANLMGQYQKGIALSLFATDKHDNGGFPEMFYRTGYNGSWRDWQRILTDLTMNTDHSVLFNSLHRLGNNPTLPTTNEGLSNLGVFISYFDKGNQFKNQPTTYGQLINIPPSMGGKDMMQFWISQSDGNIYMRGGNSNTPINDAKFKRVVTYNDLTQDNSLIFNSLHRLGKNPTLPTTNKELSNLGVFVSYLDKANAIPNQPTQYGQLINLPPYIGTNEGVQLWLSHPDGAMYHRGGNSSTPVTSTKFKRFLDSDDYNRLQNADKVVSVPVTNVKGTDHITDVVCLKSGHVVWVQFTVLKVEGGYAGSRANASITGLPKPLYKVWTLGDTMGLYKGMSHLRGFVDEDYFTWHYCPAWKTADGDECVYNFTYLTND